VQVAAGAALAALLVQGEPAKALGFQYAGNDQPLQTNARGRAQLTPFRRRNARRKQPNRGAVHREMSIALVWL